MRKNGLAFRSFAGGIILCFLHALPALPQASGDAPAIVNEQREPSIQPVPVAPVAPDAQIADRLRRILESTGWYMNPRASVRESVAFLDGTTNTQEHRDWAGALAENTEGVVAVVNRIEVNADVQSTFGRAGQEIGDFFRRTANAWPLLVLVVLIAFATWLAAKLVAALAGRFVARRIASPLLQTLAVRALSIPVIVLGVYFVLQVSGLTRLAITVLGGTGLIGIIIGFGFRDIAENFLASLLLSVRNPFRQGDMIEVGGQTGIVQNLNTRSTVLLTLEGNHVQIPNATIFKSTITNYSSISRRRAEYMVGISYDSSTSKAQDLIAGILRDHPAVLKVPEPLVLVDELGAATVNLRIYYWYNSTSYSPIKINSALMRLTKDVLLSEGIELPDAAREVLFPKGVPIVRMEGASKPHSPATDTSIPAPVEDKVSATTSEGDLSNETPLLHERSEETVPEAEENLLKS